jgi:hypothetical protein
LGSHTQILSSFPSQKYITIIEKVYPKKYNTSPKNTQYKKGEVVKIKRVLVYLVMVFLFFPMTLSLTEIVLGVKFPRNPAGAVFAIEWFLISGYIWHEIFSFWRRIDQAGP